MFFDAPSNDFTGMNTRRLVIHSFSQRHGPLRPTPTEGLLFDVRGIPNPPKDIRAAHNGTSPELRAYLMGDETVRRRIGDIASTINAHLARIDERGESVNEVTAALGCELGKNRSVACAEELGRLSWPRGWDVEVRHRELPRS